MPLHHDRSKNHILSRLSAEDFGLLAPCLTSVDLPLRKQLEERNTLIENAYFIECGLASVVANGTGHRGVEVGIIGREGMTGLAIIMATDRSPHETFMQSAGGGQRITAADLRKTMEKSATLHRSLLQYRHAFVVQTAYTALSNSRSKVEERLARWLLMAHDRADGNELHSNPRVSGHHVGDSPPWRHQRAQLPGKTGLGCGEAGTISIVDRHGLEEAANGAYGAPEAELRRLFS